uniref:Uncharacterized protein n=1 Tax=Panagrolaimus sp. PS1159 TaxID=55785 RepID=A0AC35F1T1_9BILA
MVNESNDSASLKYIEQNNSKKDSIIWRCKFDKRNDNTLSLNFDVLENSIGMKDIQSEKSKFCLKNIKGIVVKQPSTSLIKEMFEIPRQQQDVESNINEPEIMQFKSSQKLLDANQSTPKKKSQLRQNLSLSIPKRGSSINHKNNEIRNPFYTMPSQMEPISDFEWSLEQRARIRPAVFDSDFNYISPMNSESDMKNDTFWSSQIIAPSPVHQQPNFDIFSMVSTQTDISIPIDFNLAEILPSFQDVLNRSPSFDLILSSSGQNNISDGPNFGEQQRYDLNGDELLTNFFDDLQISPIGSAYGDD